MDWKYYYLNENAKTVYFSSIEQQDRDDLTFLGKSKNPNPKMAVAVFTQNNTNQSGYKIKLLS